MPYPHLHVERAGTDTAPLTHRTHVPTGRIVLEQVVRLAITQFHVRPLVTGWEQVLDEAEGKD